MRHSKISKPPCQNRTYCQKSIWRSSSCRYIIALEHGQITRKFFCIINNGIQTACYIYTKNQYNQQSYRHNNTLNEVCGRCCKESTKHRVSHNNNRTDNHGSHIIDSEQTGEQLPTCCKSRCCIRNKENYNDRC